MTTIKDLQNVMELQVLIKVHNFLIEWPDSDDSFRIVDNE